ncbi:DUF3320 domain-containing protein [Rhodococcus sp. H36-A4]|uniref:DUF3320 domain-containing protein n=1 Tax=Rhodococcus sp. H36-A4 TaxID=3004353 RepID=UPI0022AE7E4F|nr:DUF3320 domain-containing protein [Rhodococcus sp. H36-A4]MCZ4080308.1 DUF3320 domain-containing protein [Rhodococcus sp. H36-A4]
MGSSKTNVGTLTPELIGKLDRQLASWREKLLTLDRRQRLVYFKHTKVGSLEFADPGPETFLAQLSTGSLTVRVKEADGSARPTGRSVYVKDKTRETLATSMRRIDTQSNQAYADRGVWTLNLGLWMLRWTDADDAPVESPLLLIPVRVQRSGADQPYSMSRTEDDITVNPALKLKMDEFGVTLPDIDPDIVALEPFLAQLRRLIADKKEWSVETRTVLSNFTFHKEAMYRDLASNKDIVARHPIVQLLSLGPQAPSAGNYGFTPLALDTLDEVRAPEELFSILDADSAQRRCILTATSGKSFVMDGPPGTGKSQTIANMIAELIAADRTVLFVSEKAAALDVVRDRLDNANLKHFLFELHSHAATRKGVAEELGKSLHQRLKVQSTFGDQDASRLGRTRRELSEFASAMNGVDPKLKRSVYSVVGRLTELGERVDISLSSDARWAKLSADSLDELRQHAEHLGKLWWVVEKGDQYLWRGLARTDLNGEDARTYARIADRAAASASALLTRAETIDQDTGIEFGASLDAIDRRRRLLELSDSRIGTPSHWYASSELPAVRARLGSARKLVTDIDKRVRELTKLAGPRWAELDSSRRGTLHIYTDNTIDGEMMAADVETRIAKLVELQSTLSEIVEAHNELCALLGLPFGAPTLRRVTEIADLAQIGAANDLPERTWLNAAILQRISESIDVLESVVEHANRRQGSLQDVFTPAALDLDLSALNVRFRDTHTGLRKWSSSASADKKALKSVTVSGRVDKSVLGRLEEAASWQMSVREVAEKEAQHSANLGSKYRGQVTEFDRARAALDNARLAVRLAGADIDPGTLATQISSTAEADPRLLVVAAHARDAVQHWTALLRSVPAFSDQTANPNSSLDELSAWASTSHKSLQFLLPVLQQISEIAQYPVSLAAATTMLDESAAVATKTDELASVPDFDQTHFGVPALSAYSNFDDYEMKLCHAEAFQELLRGPVSADVADQFSGSSSTFADFDEVVSGFETGRDEFLGLFARERRTELERELVAGVAEFGLLLREFEEAAAGEVEEWCDATTELRWFDEIGYSSVLGALRKTGRTPTDVAEILEYAALEAWIDSRSRNDRRLKQYRALDRNQAVEAFRTLDTELVKNARARVIEQCNRRAPINVNSRAAGIITREKEKKTRHKPVRKLLEETGSLVQQIKPCFMMSPLAVSQFLPPDLRFDVVIFDEASQVLPSDAVNCVYRGDQLIVAGDQKQLPPTDFFSATADDLDADEDDEMDVFDSVLDLAKGAGGLTSLPLNWHYRSRHEDLISFSNYSFYDGSLNTFPGAVFEAPDLGVELQYVRGTYRRGTTRDNPVEASKVAERVAWFREHNPNDSIGVVTFSSAQADCVLAEIDRQSTTTSSLYGVTSEHDRLDGFFVKSLENVQGDERDIIIFSLGYGPTEEGKLHSNFGPLNRAGGWRRLNVAITRARKRVEVVASFRASELPDSNNPSIRHLKNYLDFAEHGPRTLAIAPVETDDLLESPFEEQVVSAIQRWGYDVVSQVGVAGYKIDIAIRHPSRPGTYALGIECDGAAYFSGKTARDRDRLRDQVLRSLGWSIHRIWALSWWRDRSGQEKLLRLAIEAAITDGDRLSLDKDDRRGDDGSGPTVEYTEVGSLGAREWTTGYVAVSQAAGGTREIKTPEGRLDAKRFFEDVISVESPVHADVLYERFRTAWGVGRLGAAIKPEVDRAMNRASPYGADERGFYRSGSHIVDVVRIPDHGQNARKLVHVATDEIAIAVCRIVQESVSIDDKNLMSQVVELFGGQRVSAESKGLMISVVESLIKDGRLHRDQSGDLVAVLID